MSNEHSDKTVAPPTPVVVDNLAVAHNEERERLASVLNAERARALDLENDFALGVKKPVDDLCWYENWLKPQFCDSYRHKETQTIYDFVGIGFAATGKGTLATMVHYKPNGMQGPVFERQLEPFRQKFEAVCQKMTWETMA